MFSASFSSPSLHFWFFSFMTWNFHSFACRVRLYFLLKDKSLPNVHTGTGKRLGHQLQWPWEGEVTMHRSELQGRTLSASSSSSVSSSPSPPPTSTQPPSWSQCQDSLLVRTADTDQPLLGPNQGKNFTSSKFKENPSFAILILLQVNMRPLVKGAKPFRMTTSTETQLLSRSNKATLLVVV